MLLGEVSRERVVVDVHLINEEGRRVIGLLVRLEEQISWLGANRRCEFGDEFAHAYDTAGLRAELGEQSLRHRAIQLTRQPRRS